ncbi:uncharacterized protein LOC144704982 [Wolffia australiana]
MAASITDLIKLEKFEGIRAAQNAFDKLKCLMSVAPVLRLPNFEKVFEVACDASERHYFLPKEFILYSDHSALRHLHDQRKVSDRHARWIEYLQDYTFVIRPKKGKENAVTDVLSRRPHVLNVAKVQLLGFEQVKEHYDDSPDFGTIYDAIRHGPTSTLRDYYISDGYLFHDNRLCIPRTSLRDFLIWETHAGGLSCHFRVAKTIHTLKYQF